MWISFSTREVARPEKLIAYLVTSSHVIKDWITEHAGLEIAVYTRKLMIDWDETAFILYNKIFTDTECDDMRVL